MAISAISGLGFNNYNSVSFEGTGVKKARREANAEARQMQTQAPIAEQAPVSNPGRNMVTVPAATLAALLMVATPAMMSPQTAAAQSNTGTNASKSVFGNRRVGIVVEEGQEIPNPEDYINKWVMFRDGDTYSGIMVRNARNTSNCFYEVGYLMIDGDDVDGGVVRGFNAEQGYFICEDKGGFMKVDATQYSDTRQALQYIQRAFESNANRSIVINENSLQKNLK